MTTTESDTTRDEPRGMLGEIARIYRDSRKEQDIFWNVYVARPLAAVLLYFLRRTALTPNQVTFLGAVAFLGVAAALILMRDWTGMLVAAAILQFAYILDCADGQLARLKSMTSEVGAYLDFLIDEVKALILVGAFSVRLWLVHDELVWLLVGLGGMALVSIATSLTNFVRRPEYAGRDIKPGESARRKSGAPKGLMPKALWLVQSFASWLVHYPSWFVYLALLDGLDGFDGSAWFMYLFLGVYALYAGKTGLGVLVKLGRPGFYK
ncbi:CDP-alcohol phosphatidyltransferase family protein [Persicimonas caeni]|uniref:CDP-alcohol phosphatidyltransferase family protein n=1 Tax=Persicimonas caeni TaxID=2292766 RepID=A0A4Y6PVV6_PERCE|nr:CDP-alcohol phosphatidyltransferase family protein [Persicimonas caeni]QDG52462.1 CDP-alcohol phosphatidyltransferase family protein [Persicimonas caeni]QED33684.1 CDP-alcohol phosphatidyltransferase family protein [Persicimonas caeni]